MTGVPDGANQEERAPFSIADSGLIDLAGGDDHGAAGAVAILPASILVRMPPRDSSEAAPPAIASISGVISAIVSRNRASRIEMRRRGVEPVDIGQQDQQVGAGHGGDAGGQPVIVAIADFAGGDRVVLVDDRHGADLQQLVDRGAGIEIAAALFGVAERQQDLAGDDLVARQAFRPGAGQRDLADGRGRLAFLELQRAGGQIEHRAAERDGAGGDDEDIDALGLQRRRYRRTWRPATPSSGRSCDRRAGPSRS